ncbi:hypothetical protein V8G54_006928 [Vigna mungo]|uniref:YTH domain-containing family protein n=1 Tax=Vigna mungo TaxID=3915 RepID=A0AAQ3S8H5_VIGMU
MKAKVGGRLQRDFIWWYSKEKEEDNLLTQNPFCSRPKAFSFSSSIALTHQSSSSPLKGSELAGGTLFTATVPPLGPSPCGFRMVSVDNKLKVANGRENHYFKRNIDGFGELNKGPISSNGSNDKSMKSPRLVTPLTEGQNLRIKSDNKELLLIPNKKLYNREDFSENYSDAKFCLDATYHEDKEKPGDCPIFLLFLVNTSGQFVGLAEKVSPIDFGTTMEYWQQDRWTGCFFMQWHIIKDIPNSVLRHITLENDENKHVNKSLDEAFTNESTTTGEAGQKENLVEENGSTTQAVEENNEVKGQDFENRAFYGSEDIFQSIPVQHSQNVKIKMNSSKAQ